MSQNGTSTQLKPASRKAIAQAAEAKRRQIEGDTSADPAADDNDVGGVWPKSEPDDEPRIKQEPSAPAQRHASYWSAPSPDLNWPTQPTSYLHLQSNSHNALKHEELDPAAEQGFFQSTLRPYPLQYPVQAFCHSQTISTPSNSIERSISPKTIIKQEMMSDRDGAETQLMTDTQHFTDDSGLCEYDLSRTCINEAFAPPISLDRLHSAGHNASLASDVPTTSILQRSNHAADLDNQHSRPSCFAGAQEVIVIAD